MPGLTGKGSNSSLRAERLRHHWSQQEVADRIGTTPNNVSRWELGMTTPGPYFRGKLCDLFNKSAKELGLDSHVVENGIGSAPQSELLISDAHRSGHSFTVAPLNIMRELYELLGNNEQAESALQRVLATDGRIDGIERLALAILERALWPEHPEKHIGEVDGTLTTKREADPLAPFLSEYCLFHPQAWCLARDLWQAYQDWTHESGERFPLSRRVFARYLKARGAVPDRTNTCRIWRGIALAEREREVTQGDA